MKIFIGLMLLGLFAGIYGASLRATCPNGLATVYCFVDPCMVQNTQGCHGYPNAVCQSNYCGGCNCECFDNGSKVTCH
ncbi:hypothetical protein ACF0H5_023772 [Mactra antiquata]